MHIEIVKETFAGQIIVSEVRLATDDEIEEANLLCQDGKCPHNIVRDEHGWMYDTRFCCTCGACLGLI